MKTTNKIIKYFAVALAVFLIITIFSSIAYGIYGIAQIFEMSFNIGSSFDDDPGFENAEEFNSETFDEALIKSIVIDITGINLIIRNGDELKAETDSDNVYYKVNGSSLRIIEKRKSWFGRDNSEKIVLYIPVDSVFQNIDISAGAGKIEAEEIDCEHFNLDVGAGKAYIGKLNVSGKSVMEVGAGKIEVSLGNINGLDLQVGTGKADVKAAITGKADVEVGIGSIDFHLIGTDDDYMISAEKGLGNISVDGQQLDDDDHFGSGGIKVDVESGIGSINVDFVTED